MWIGRCQAHAPPLEHTDGDDHADDHPLPQGASIGSKKKKASPKDQVWLDAQKRYGLSDVHIRMARELGLNPRKFGKLANTRQEPWKAPLPEFIEQIYAKRFGKTRPDKIQPSRPPAPREEADH